RRDPIAALRGLGAGLAAAVAVALVTEGPSKALYVHVFDWNALPWRIELLAGLVVVAVLVLAVPVATLVATRRGGPALPPAGSRPASGATHHARRSYAICPAPCWSRTAAFSSRTDTSRSSTISSCGRGSTRRAVPLWRAGGCLPRSEPVRSMRSLARSSSSTSM